jgi:hypothetical protein
LHSFTNSYPKCSCQGYFIMKRKVMLYIAENKDD